MRKLLIILFSMLVFTPLAFADETFKTHFDLAEQYYKQAKYTSAISEYQKALRINNLDNSARIGLINSHLDRATYYVNTLKDFERAANDYRSALFYLEVYPTEETMQNAAQVTSDVKDNLEKCFTEIKFDKSSYSRYNKAVEIRGLNDYAAAAYEFYRATLTGDSNIVKNGNKNIADIIKSRTGNFKRAGEFYSKALVAAPNDAYLHACYAQMLMKTNQEELAIDEFNKALATSPNPKGILQSLEKLYANKLQQNPNSINTVLNLASVLHKQGKDNEAITYYKKAETMNANNEIVLMKLGEYYLDTNNNSKALDYFTRSLNINPNNSNTNCLVGDLYIKTKEKEKAIDYYKKALEINPNNADAQSGLIIAVADVMTPAELIKYLSFGKDTPSVSVVNSVYDYAKELHSANKAKNAIPYYKEILRYKDVPEVYINLALAQVQEDKEPDAINTLVAARQKYPGNQQIQKTLDDISKDVNNQKYAKASELFNNNEYQKALDVYKEINPDSAEKALAIAACYKSLNNIDQALVYYKQALEFNPNNSDIAYYIGVLYTELENWTSAKISLQKALKINPNNTKAKELLASVVEQNNILLINSVIEKYNKGDYTEALKLISQVLTEDPNNAYAHYYRGLIYDSQKKYNQAIEEYKKSYKNNPTLVVANYLIAIVYDTQAQYAKALEFYKKFVSENKENDEYKAYANSRIHDLKGYEK